MQDQLSDKQKSILYRIAIRQDEQGRQPSNIMMKQLLASSLYTDLFDLEYLTYEKMGEGEKAIAGLYVTLKGLRYCAENSQELSRLDKEAHVLDV